MAAYRLWPENGPEFVSLRPPGKIGVFKKKKELFVKITVCLLYTIQHAPFI
jgi:hypothetical protein